MAARRSRGKLEFARRRARRHGVRKAVDEAAFYLAFHRLLKRRDDEELSAQVIDPYERPTGGRSGAATPSRRERERAACLSFLREREPGPGAGDVHHELLREEIRSIPRHGVFLWHEGFTPEYKGLYSPFWAAHNLDFDRIGYTLLRMNDEYDAGQVFARAGPATSTRCATATSTWATRRSGTAFPTSSGCSVSSSAVRRERSIAPEQKTGMYTYPGLSDLIRQRIRFRRAGGGGRPARA